jgi:hypothetical protein
MVHWPQLGKGELYPGPVSFPQLVEKGAGIIPHRQSFSALEGKRGLRIHVTRSLSSVNPGSDPETIDAGTIPARYQAMLDTKSIILGGHHTINYDHDRDMIWRYDQVLPTHPNGMRFSVFDEAGDMLATNEYFRCAVTRRRRKM